MPDRKSSFNPAVNIYISYESTDKDLFEDLLKYFKFLPWERMTIASYDERQILATLQRDEMESHLNSADIVVLIVSSAYLDSMPQRRWELQQITTKAKIFIINLTSRHLSRSLLKEFGFSWFDDSRVTFWECQSEDLKLAAETIYNKVASSISTELNFSTDSYSVSSDANLISEKSYSTRGMVEEDVRGRGIEPDLVVHSESLVSAAETSTPRNLSILTNQRPESQYNKDVVRFQKQLEQVYRIPEQPQPSTSTDKDLVDCSVFSPSTVICGDMFLVQVFIHLPEQAEIARQKAELFDPDTKQLGVRSLGIPIEQGAELTFYLSIPNLEVDDPIQDFIWNGQADSRQFGVTVPPNMTPKTVIGTVSVSQNSIPIGHLKFKLSIAPSSSSKLSESQPSGEAARLYKKAFVSYSSKDRKEVLKRVQGLTVTGIEIFQDVLNLEPGDRWEQELYRHIDECDLFLLFWSTAAKESKWVLKEALYALERQGKDGLNPPEIIPVILEGPPPVSPPNELRHLHFNDKLLYLIAMSR